MICFNKKLSKSKKSIFQLQHSSDQTVVKVPRTEHDLAFGAMLRF